MNVLYNIGIVIITFIVMELVAWSAHKFLMHGLLWRLHKDHHTRENLGFFEKNDYFFLLFATPGIINLIYGIENGFVYQFYIGLGITLYGLTYFFVHDLFIHQRIKVLRNTKSKYLLGIRRAHKIHHKHLGKYDGEAFGMLWVPLKFFK